MFGKQRRDCIGSCTHAASDTAFMTGCFPERPVFRRTVCFVRGCFWHRHAGCRYAKTPATRTDFWQAKFDANVTRDLRNRRALLDAGRRIATVMECALKNGGETGVASLNGCGEPTECTGSGDEIQSCL